MEQEKQVRKSWFGRHILLMVLLVVIAAVIVGSALYSSQQGTPSSPPPTNGQSTSNLPLSSATSSASGEISLAELAKNPSAYDKAVISTRGIVIGVKAETSQSQIQDGDYDAYLVDGSFGVPLSIYQNPAIKQVATGDIVEVTGTFYYGQFEIGANLLGNSSIVIGAAGSISVVGKSNSVVPPSQTLSKVENLLAMDSSNIAAAANQAASASSYKDCIKEYTMIWDAMCSAANLPSQCTAVNYLDSVKAINRSTESLLVSCDMRFPYATGTTIDYSNRDSVDRSVRMIINISNEVGFTVSSAIAPQP